MKKVGIIGGIGPASTLDYYSGIIEGYRNLVKKDVYPSIVINSINMTEMLTLLSENRMDELVGLLVSSISELEAAGADFAVIASNTPHIVFDQVKSKAKLRLISIIEATCQVAKTNKYQKVAVLGTKFTMGNGLYTEAFKKYDMEAIVPSQQEQEAIHNIIFPNLENGIVDPEEKQRMLKIAEDIIRTHGADSLVLGCTELPLMIKQEDVTVPILNTTQIHIESIIEVMIK